MFARTMLGVLLSGFLLYLPSLALAAEFLCQSEVSYTWQKTGEEEPIKVVWTNLALKGEVEDDVKLSLSEAIHREKTTAVENCRKEHENFSGCVATKFLSMSSVMERLSFSARKALEEAIQSDCKVQQGLCKGSMGTEIQCKDIAPAEEGEEEDSGKKKKKKKKK